MQEILPGQRWISEAEPDLGLGLVVEVDNRTATVLFPASKEQRAYARQQAPLSRVQFQPGDTIGDHDGRRLTVQSVNDEAGILLYTCHDDAGAAVVLPETRLDHRMRLVRPLERLLAGLIDKTRWFELRRDAARWAGEAQRSPARGLLGARIEPIAHQLYIANEVGQRSAPRVLLADEVGLGKTIEAGLILHQQLLTGRARRVLIVVPDNLVFQWFIEMWRRFNLRFSIFDEDRCLAIDAENPFLAEQLVLVGTDFFKLNPERHAQAIKGEWDLLVVDEAHRLEWHADEPGEDYLLIEQLAADAKGVLLLTATPEQFGRGGHFARLRLLDPHRFHDFNVFCEDEEHYQPVAGIVNSLLDGQALSAAQQATLKTLLGDYSLEDVDGVLRQLVDRHGTGRVLFRNTRSAISGFPKRKVVAHNLDNLQSDTNQTGFENSVSFNVLPEQDQKRTEWLANLLRELKPEKVLVICSAAETAVSISAALRDKFGVLAGVFHEGVDLIARDRAAAWFADREEGVQVLICSEIGSEGRNFQFAHHLVLFDLPANPDLLEQRIGRLDRIGQRFEIQIHVPYLPGTKDQRLFRWYHEGLDAFETTCADGVTVFNQLGERMQGLLSGDCDLDQLISDTQKIHQTLVEKVQQGRDRLLEFNSNNPDIARSLIAAIDEADFDNHLGDFLNRAFDALGIDTEELSAHIWLARPSDHMHIDALPGLPEDGIRYCLRRDIALLHDDVQFITWEHPLVAAVLDVLNTTEMGNSAVTVIKDEQWNKEPLLLEALFAVECSTLVQLDLKRFIEAGMFRVLVDMKGNEVSESMPSDTIDGYCLSRDRVTSGKVLRSQQAPVKSLYEHALRHAEEQLKDIVEHASNKASQEMTAEIKRLKQLQVVNPSVRNDEIEYLELMSDAIGKALAGAGLRLDAVRLVIVN